MSKTLEEMNKEQQGQLAIYKNEINKLNVALNRRSYSAKKVRELVEVLRTEIKELRNRLEEYECLTFNDSENPDMGKADEK